MYPFTTRAPNPITDYVQNKLISLKEKRRLNRVLGPGLIYRLAPRFSPTT
jgi:hypothetical protein